MARVFLGLGSNIERERYLTAGLDALEVLLGELSLSSVYDSPAIGFTGQPFLNMVIAADTGLTLDTLAARLRHIEHEHGRPPDATRFSSRQLDIDILTYDELVGDFPAASGTIVLPRAEILENAFVLCPLAELAPHEQHPGVARTYAQLWREYDQSSQYLERVDFRWKGRSVSTAGAVD